MICCDNCVEKLLLETDVPSNYKNTCLICEDCEMAYKILPVNKKISVICQSGTYSFGYFSIRFLEEFDSKLYYKISHMRKYK